MIVPTGMFLIGSVLPGLMSARFAGDDGVTLGQGAAAR